MRALDQAHSAQWTTEKQVPAPRQPYSSVGVSSEGSSTASCSCASAEVSTSGISGATASSTRALVAFLRLKMSTKKVAMSAATSATATAMTMMAQVGKAPPNSDATMKVALPWSQTITMGSMGVVSPPAAVALATTT